MKIAASQIRSIVRGLVFALVAVTLLIAEVRAAWADGRPKVHLNTSAVTARTVEGATEISVARDYGAAWQTLSDALDFNATTLLDAYFVGPARKAFGEAIAGQQNTGIHSRLINQDHKLEAVFYAPEGDVMELHDTMTCELQVLDQDKMIHNEQVTLRYVVLMTPGADRWTIRQLQSVPKF